MLGLSGSVRDEGWRWNREALQAGHSLDTPTPLFAKLEEALIEEETLRIGN